MKKSYSISRWLFLLLLTFGVNAQASEADYFAGKRKMIVF